MPWHGPSHVARGPGGRGAQHAIRPWDLYPAARPGSPGAAEPASALWAPLSHGRADASGHRRGPQASRRGDRRVRRAPYLGPATPPTSTFIIPGIVNLLILRKK